MNRFLMLALLAGLSAPALAQEAQIIANTGGPGIQQPQILDLNVMEALVAVGAGDLAGVFGFIPERAAPAAFADYLLHNRKALKKFLKRGERDLKETGGISDWDKTVFMNIMQINGSGLLPPTMKHLTSAEEMRVSAMVLAKALSLQEMAAVRGGRR